GAEGGHLRPEPGRGRADPGGRGRRAVPHGGVQPGGVRRRRRGGPGRAPVPARRPAVGPGRRAAAGDVPRAEGAGRLRDGAVRAPRGALRGYAHPGHGVLLREHADPRHGAGGRRCGLLLAGVDAKKAVLEVESYYRAISLSTQTALRDIIGTHTLQEMLTQREALGRALREALDAKTNPWGITVQSVEVRDVIIPANLQNAMSKQAQA